MEMEVTFPGGKKVDAAFKGFTVRTDQTKKNGGDGSAPEPFDLLLVSNATCAGYFVLQFCLERNLPTEEIKLQLRLEKDQKIKIITKILIEIQLPLEFPEKYKKAVIRAVELCPVKKLMENPPAFEIFTTVQ